MPRSFTALVAALVLCLLLVPALPVHPRASAMELPDYHAWPSATEQYVLAARRVPATPAPSPVPTAA
ncbi:MAG TPA: hypothetical protein VHK28_02825, partial [Candidatus Limnocylindria bacterium]|nr:hypothetical protein [Candidatus Limnocylindria bacterium]